MLALRQRACLGTLFSWTLLLAPSPLRPAELSCSLCRGPIDGPYVRFESAGLDVCVACADSPACGSCGLPLAGHLAGAEGHCSRCIGTAPRCASCGLPIFEQYWTIQGASGRYCSSCKEGANVCHSCRAPVRRGDFRDGRFFCAECSKTLLSEEKHYETLFEDVLFSAGAKLGIALKKSPSLIVESLEALRAPLPGQAGSVCGLFERTQDGKSSIRVLSHMTRPRVTAVLAHELAHAWQAENCPEEQSLRIREGFAEWVAWKLLEGAHGCETERELIETRSDEYGRGFLLFARLAEDHGEDYALWYARSVSRNETPDGS